MTDADLVKLTQAGDADAFERLVERHRHRCFGIAYHLLENQADAEDEVQNAFIQVFLHIDQFRSPDAFASWLRRIVEMQVFMRIRERNRLKRRHPEDAIGEPRDPQPDPESRMSTIQLYQAWQREKQRMPPLFRGVLMLDHLPIEAAASALGLTISGAKSRLFRARIELQHRMRKYVS